jgi:ATP-binding cassette subfamily C (CFTR/MRP) protein 1
MSAAFLQESFSKLFEHAGFRGQKNALAKIVARTLVVPLLLPVVPRIALIGFGFCQPFLIQALLSWLDEPESATVLIYTGIPITTAFY